MSIFDFPPKIEPNQTRKTKQKGKTATAFAHTSPEPSSLRPPDAKKATSSTDHPPFHENGTMSSIFNHNNKARRAPPSSHLLSRTSGSTGQKRGVLNRRVIGTSNDALGTTTLRKKLNIPLEGLVNDGGGQVQVQRHEQKVVSEQQQVAAKQDILKGGQINMDEGEAKYFYERMLLDCCVRNNCYCRIYLFTMPLLIFSHFGGNW
jgi:hypothetical protein